jgi:hypothetical protein
MIGRLKKTVNAMAMRCMHKQRLSSHARMSCCRLLVGRVVLATRASPDVGA